MHYLVSISHFLPPYCAIFSRQPAVWLVARLIPDPHISFPFAMASTLLGPPGA